MSPTHLFSQFQYCPRCRKGHLSRKIHEFKCTACRLHFFINPGCAVAAIIEDSRGQLLLTRRAKAPCKNMFGLPGGFIDPGETAEEALHREVMEELNLKIRSLKYHSSFPNRYRFDGVIYSVLDFFYLCKVESFKPIEALDEIAGFHFVEKRNIQLNKIAFPSMRKALGKYLMGH